MYLNQHSRCCYIEKQETKSNKIFRPWDNEDSINNINFNKFKPYVPSVTFDDCAQDATISTTTEGDLMNNRTEATKCDSKLPTASKDSQMKLRKLETSNEELRAKVNLSEQTIESKQHFADYFRNSERYPLYPDLMNIQLAQSLGLTPTDPLFLEYISQGCSVEEYSRVISQEQQAKILTSRKQRPKKYRCPHCEVGFSNNGQLKGHIRIHTGERPFRCDEDNCGKTFTRNEELTRHKRIHSGLRPFPCTHCGKRFGRKDHLKKHSRTHFQPQGLYAVPVMLPFETWTSSAYSYLPMFTY